MEDLESETSSLALGTIPNQKCMTMNCRGVLIRVRFRLTKRRFEI